MDYKTNNCDSDLSTISCASKKKKAQSFNLPLQLDIPFWYDEISYDTKYGNGILSEWLIDHSDGVTIMAYRDNSQEIIKIAKNEIEYAKQMNKKKLL